MKIKKWLSIPLILSLLVSTAAFTNADVVDEPEETNANEAEEVVEETVFSEEISAEETIEDASSRGSTELRLCLWVVDS